MSLLSSIDKIVERFKYNRLHEFLEFKNLIFDIQFDFRQKHSEAGVQRCCENMHQNYRRTLMLKCDFNSHNWA